MRIVLYRLLLPESIIDKTTTGSLNQENMDLFHMKRYWSDGEDRDDDKDQSVPNSEADILNKLKNKVMVDE